MTPWALAFAWKRQGNCDRTPSWRDKVRVAADLLGVGAKRGCSSRDRLDAPSRGSSFTRPEEPREELLDEAVPAC